MSAFATWLARARGGIAARPFHEAQENPEQAQQALLKQILYENAGTRFGIDHDFGTIGDVGTYQQRVPIRDYEGHRPWVDQLLEGQPHQLTNQSPFMFGTTSGTTNQPKLVPITTDWHQKMAAIQRIWIARTSRSHPGMLDGKVLTLLSPAVEGYARCGLPVGSVSGQAGCRVPWIIRRQYALPYEVCEIEDYTVRYRVSMRLSMAQLISIVVTPNPATLVRLAEVGRAQAQRFVDAIRAGELGVDIDHLSQEQRDICHRLTKGLKARPRRADALQRILDEHGELLPKHYWPAIAVIGCWLGGSAGVQARALRPLYGDVPVRDLGFRATEATFTLPLTDGTPDGALTLHANFFEFVPVDEIDTPNPTCQMAHQLEVGKQYYIITTTLGGLYRYDINDIIEVTGTFRNAPLIRFIRKGRDMVNIIGEKLHVNQFLEAATDASQETGINWEQFRMVPDVDAARYDLLLETTDNTTPDEFLRGFVAAFDQALCRVNVEYPTKRNSGRLHLPKLYVMKPGWSERAIHRDVTEHGRRDSQYKWAYIQREWDDTTRQEVSREVDTG